MPEFPETRESLLARVRDPQDEEAWCQFVAVYRPVIYRLARARGLQDADAQDLTQTVLASVARAIRNWEPNAERARFRCWLSRVVRNAAINALTRGPWDVPAGGTDMIQLLEQQPQLDDETQRDFDHEYQRAVFRWARDQIQGEFHVSTWDAFWLTTVEGRNVDQAAAQLNKSLGAVYAARSRVMRRLREVVRQFEEENVAD
jgi:RNA polymerase sigma-70 factor (ECF subfamily)